MGMLLGMGANVAVEHCSLTVVVERREMSAIQFLAAVWSQVKKKKKIARHNSQMS